MASSNNAINNTVGATISGVTNTLTITNGSNTASSAASNNIYVGGTSAGNAWQQYSVGSARSWAVGVNNGSSQAFQINTNNSGTVQPGSGTNVWSMTTAGQRSLPLQCTFLTSLSATTGGVTGDGTAYTIVFDNSTYNVNSNYDTGTGFFTAPVTGKYIFHAAAFLIGITPAMTSYEIQFILSTGTIFRNKISNAGGFATGNVAVQLTAQPLLNAGDTVHVIVSVGGGAKVVTVLGESPSVAYDTYFEGFLLA